MKKLVFFLLASVVIFVIQNSMLAADYPATSELEYRTYVDPNYGSLPFRLFVPKNYDPNASYPIVVFLHGSGEVGTDNEKQLKNNGNGSLWLINTDYQVNYPMFFVAPQGSWGDVKVQAKVAGMINALKEEFSGIDPDRVIITGLSLGGGGTYSMMSKYPDIVAGGVPMQGPTEWVNISNNKNMNIWHFHAVDDNSGYHPISTADYCVGYLRGKGLNVVYTRYNTGGHGIWPEAYKNPQLISWLYATRKGVKTTVSPFVNVDYPTAESTYNSEVNSIDLSGSAGNADTIISHVDWKNSRGGSGAVSGTENWAIDNVPLKEGENIVQVIASGTSWSVGKGGNTTFNDSLIVNYQPGGVPVNAAPIANAGTDQNIQLPVNTVNLQGSASDDGQPAGTLTYSWNVTSGPGTVVFGNKNAAASTAELSEVGAYTLSLTVSDGELSDTDQINITLVAEPNEQLQNVALNKPVAVDSLYNATYIGEKAVDGDTSNVSSRWLSANDGNYHWIEIDLQGDFEISEMRLWSGYKNSGFAIQNYWFQTWNGSEWLDLAVRADNTSQQTVEVFNPVVSNKVRLLCGNEDLARIYEIAVYGVPAVIANLAPVVNAGTDQLLVWPENSVSLSGTATDDGMPSGVLVYLWSKVSGPGNVSFSNEASATTSANFATPGNYVLRLEVSDGDLISGDEVQVSIASNICLNKPVTVDSVYNASYVGGNGVDGDHENVVSRWLSANTGQEHWIEIDLQGEHMINEMKLWTGYRDYGFAVKDFRLQIWQNGSWTDVLTVNDNTDQYREESFEPVVTVKIRLLCGSDDLARVYELEVIGVGLE